MGTGGVGVRSDMADGMNGIEKGARGRRGEEGVSIACLVKGYFEGVIFGFLASEVLVNQWNGAKTTARTY